MSCLMVEILSIATCIMEIFSIRQCGNHSDGEKVDVELAAEAVERARAGEGPTLIEADTYRHSGHSRSDPAKYRPADEVEHWFARDPITLLERAMTRDDPSAQQVIDDVGARVDGEIRSALDAALASPEPDPAERFLDVYA